MTGHTEAVRVVYDPAVVSYADLLKVFWETHDPTQGFRQGNDLGTQYRSPSTGRPTSSERQPRQSRDVYQAALTKVGLGAITTEMLPAPTFYYAEDHHQQYLAKVPNGYDCHANTGIPYPRAERSPPAPNPPLADCLRFSASRKPGTAGYPPLLSPGPKCVNLSGRSNDSWA